MLLLHPPPPPPPTGQKITELIAHMDMQKNEALERTFKGVAKNFRWVCGGGGGAAHRGGG